MTLSHLGLNFYLTHANYGLHAPCQEEYRFPRLVVPLRESSWLRMDCRPRRNEAWMKCYFCARQRQPATRTCWVCDRGDGRLLERAIFPFTQPSSFLTLPSLARVITLHLISGPLICGHLLYQERGEALEVIFATNSRPLSFFLRLVWPLVCTPRRRVWVAGCSLTVLWQAK